MKQPIYFVTVVALIMTGIIMILSCNPLGENEKPKISRVESMLEDRSNAGMGGSSAFATFIVYVENPGTYPDITSLRITNPLGIYWTFEGSSLSDNWDDTDDCFVFWYCYAQTAHPDSVPLGVYVLRTYNGDNESGSYYFTVYGRNDPTLVAGYVYSASSASTPKILGTPSNCTATIADSNLNISFTADDEIITDAFVWYYNSGNNYLGFSGWLSGIAPIVTNGTNSYTLDVSGVTGLSNIYIVLYSYTTGEVNITLYRSLSPNIVL
jgi:hypothetical protein